VFVDSGFSSLVQRLRIRLEPTQVKHILGAQLYGRLLALVTYIRIGGKGRNKHSSFSGPFVSYEENKVL
jgi:hypothetical protein